jgi:hypothetical protein
MLLNRPLDEKELFSAATFCNHIKRLNKVDRQKQYEMYNKLFSGKTKFGFEMMYYLQTDGTTHGKADKRQ